MKTLGANAIRVYHVDPTADHTSCMSTFADDGIYLFVDLDTFTSQIDPVRQILLFCKVEIRVTDRLPNRKLHHGPNRSTLRSKQSWMSSNNSTTLLVSSLATRS